MKNATCPRCGGTKAEPKREPSRYDNPDPGSSHGRMMAQLADVFGGPCSHPFHTEEARCPRCGWSTGAPDYELGTDEGVNVASKCGECGRQRPAMMRITFLDEALQPTDRRNVGGGE